MSEHHNDEQTRVVKQPRVGDQLGARLAEGTPSRWWRWALAGATAIIVGLGFLWFLDLFARPLSLFIIGLALAAALSPIANRFSGRARVVVIILVYVVILAALAALLYFAGRPLVNQVQQATEEIPTLVSDLEEQVGTLPLPEDFSLTDAATNFLGGVQSQVTGIFSQLFTLLFAFVVIIFISLYALIVAPGAERFLRSLFPTGPRSRVMHVLSEMMTAMGGYVRGTIIDAIIVGLLSYGGFLLIGLNYALVLAVISALFEIIPNLGPIIAGIIVVAVALLQSPTTALWAFLLMLAIQEIEGNILIPNIMHQQARVSPLLALFAVVAGFEIGGIVGALVAIPLAAALHVLTVELFAPLIRKWSGEETSAERSREAVAQAD